MEIENILGRVAYSISSPTHHQTKINYSSGLEKEVEKKSFTEFNQS